MDDEPAIAVVVQRMVASVASGVMFTVDPASEDHDRIVIEGAFGLGEVVVGGQVEVDTYTVSRSERRVLSVHEGTQAHQIVRGTDGHDVVVPLDTDEGARRVLTDEQVLTLADVGVRVEHHYGNPQDMEWAIDAAGEMFLVQTRPITTLHDRTDSEPVVVAKGLGASPGRVVGRVRVLASPDEGADLVDGEVLVATMTSPDWVPTMRRAVALVTDGGGMTCHAAIVSRELGIPCVVGTHDGTATLDPGAVVTVDGSQGVVLAGDHAAVPDGSAANSSASPAAAAAPVQVQAVEPLATKLYVNVAIASRAAEAAALPVDGVGLLRAEFMITDALDGVHPKKLLADGRADEFVARMATLCCRSPVPSLPVPSCTGRLTSGPTSSGPWPAVTSTSPTKRTP